MLTERENYIWDTLVEYGIATNEEIGLVCVINGLSEKTLNDILEVRTGYRNIEQFINEEEENWE